jgi:hypothetical protein
VQKRRSLYPAPHVLGIQAQLPDTRVDAKVRMTEYTINSPNRGVILCRLEDNGRGEARRDVGASINRRSNGTRIIIDDKES